MSLIMDEIRPKLSELFALEFAEVAESDFIYTQASTNVDQYVPTKWSQYIWQWDLGWVRLWVRSDRNIWSYMPLNREKLFKLFLFTL